MGCKFKSNVVVNGDDIRVMRTIFINNFIFLTALSIFFSNICSPNSNL